TTPLQYICWYIHNACVAVSYALMLQIILFYGKQPPTNGNLCSPLILHFPQPANQQLTLLRLSFIVLIKKAYNVFDIPYNNPAACSITFDGKFSILQFWLDLLTLKL
ncbi:MAG: hypothetical protein RR205_04645, partial [Oscillospiraceae bacterium]